MNNQSGEKQKILVVEDDPDLNNAYCIILAHEGYEVACVTDGLEGITKLEEFSPDLVLLDLRMPNLDGVGFLRESGINSRFPKAVIIVFTNFDENEEIEQAFALGASRYVLKSSVTPKDLAKLVREELTGV